MVPAQVSKKTAPWSRREFLGCALVGTAAGLAGLRLAQHLRRGGEAEAFVARVSDYRTDFADVIVRGFRELGVHRDEVRGTRVLLKPNLVEPASGMVHINTHPGVVLGAAQAFREFGAEEVLVAEGSGHNRDSLFVLEQSGLDEILVAEGLRFVDLNYDQVVDVPNRTPDPKLKTLALPVTLGEVDWIVSLPKMKTHHWAGVTLSMKNLFGVMPGSYYGWPKNVLHVAGIDRAIIEINATVRPHFAIVDGVIGMEGDGPIMGVPKPAGVIVMGRNLTAVDATCARVMGVNPARVPHLAASNDWLGPIDAHRIVQRGEPLEAVRSPFALQEDIPAQRGLRAG